MAAVMSFMIDCPILASQQYGLCHASHQTHTGFILGLTWESLVVNPRMPVGFYWPFPLPSHHNALRRRQSEMNITFTIDAYIHWSVQ